MDPKKDKADVSAVLALAVRILQDPTNRSISCRCGVTFLSGAAKKDHAGHPLCIACGATQEVL
jgi:hypothetical protein